MCPKKFGSFGSSNMSESPVVYGISKWLNCYINAKNLSGMFNFKFIECSETREVFCLEGNPHIHSAIVNFREKSEVSCLYFSYGASINHVDSKGWRGFLKNHVGPQGVGRVRGRST